MVCTIARDIRVDCSIDNVVCKREREHERGMEGRKQTADTKDMESMGIYMKSSGAIARTDDVKEAAPAMQGDGQR